METLSSLSETAMDEKFMKRAIALGEQARLISPPNPWVGCVIVKNGTVVGEGGTQTVGKNHAEIEALNIAGTKAQGSIFYITLEPCSHYGRTPPCVDSVIKAKPARVVIALEDPDTKVCGKGIHLLKQAGIDVTLGVCSREASISLAPYLYHRKTGKSFCIVKTAMSIDGRVAAKDKSSKWITSPNARKDAHRLRAESQAILIGSGTALADNPMLTVRDINPMPANQPLRVVLDSRGTLPSDLNLFNSTAPTLIITTDKCSLQTIKGWEEKGARVQILPTSTDGQGVDFEEVLKYLGKLQIIQVLVEGGAILHGRIIKENKFQKIVVYLGSRVLGDSGIPVFKNLTIATIQDAPFLHLLHAERVGENVRLDYGATNENLF